MKTTTVANLKAHLSAVLRRVERGETILILNRGKPVARIAPPVLGVRGDDAERITRLERTGVVRPPDAVSDWVPLLRPSPVADRQGAVRAALRAEREEGR